MSQRSELLNTGQLNEACRHTSLGLKLREARERLGLSERGAAAQLFLSVDQIRALEEGRYDHLAGDVFVRGYLRSYARLLSLNPDEVIESYRPGVPRMAEAIAVDDEPAAQAAWVDAARRSLMRFPPAVLIAISCLVIALVIVIVAGLLFNGGTGDASGGPVADVATAEQGLLTVDTGLFKVVEEATELPLSPAVAVKMPAGESVSRQLEMDFSADCWVEVRDASRRILLADMRRAGDRETLVGEPPYKVLLGRIDAVDLRYQGRAVEVEAEQGKEYAQVVVGG